MPRVPQIRRRTKAGRQPFYTVEIDGVRHYLGPDPKAAHEEAARLLRGIPRDRPESVTDLIDAWDAEHPHPRNGEFTNRWFKFVGTDNISDIGPESLKRFVRHLQQRNLMPWTIRKYFGYAWRICRWAVERKWLAEMPTRPKLPRPMECPRDIDLDVLRAALDTLQPQAQAIVEFMFEMGFRPGEATGLRWEHVDRRRGACVLPAHKTAHTTGKPRVVYLTDRAREIVDAQPKTSGYVFLNRKKRPYKPSGLRSILRRRGITGANAIRPTAAQSWFDQGFDLADVAKRLGHKGLRMVLRYAQVRDARARHMAETLVSPLRDSPAEDSQQTDAAVSASRRGSQGTKRSNPGRRSASIAS